VFSRARRVAGGSNRIAVLVSATRTTQGKLSAGPTRAHMGAWTRRAHVLRYLRLAAVAAVSHHPL